MNNISFVIVMSYALGYAIGTYIGGIINKYFIDGNLMILIFTKKDTIKIRNILKKSGYGISSITMSDDNNLLLVEIRKKELKRLRKLIKEIDQKAFVIVNETLEVQNGYF